MAGHVVSIKAMFLANDTDVYSKENEGVIWEADRQKVSREVIKGTVKGKVPYGTFQVSIW